MKKLLPILLLCLGCAGAPPKAPPEVPTLFIQNDRADSLRLKVNNRYVGTAYPGASCIYLHNIPPGSAHDLSFQLFAVDEIITAPRTNFFTYTG